MKTTMTNTGSYLLATGEFVTATFWMGLLFDIPDGAHDMDLASVADLLAVPGVNEVSGGGYARTVMSNITITKDDATDYTLIGADDVDFGVIAGGAGIGRGFFIFKAGGSDAARDLAIVAEMSPQPFNGGRAVVNAAVVFKVGQRR